MRDMLIWKNIKVRDKKTVNDNYGRMCTSESECTCKVCPLTIKSSFNNIAVQKIRVG